ncbi:MAG TPA: diguanylate cyclase, partial [Pyrinomonadaceae bacterium]
LVAAERIRSTIEQYPFSVVKQGRKDTHRITMSIGVSSFPDDSSDPIELVEMADSALYRSKREGRNRVSAYRDVTDDDLKMPMPPRRG